MRSGRPSHICTQASLQKLNSSRGRGRTAYTSVPWGPGHTDLFTMDVCPRKTCRHCPVRTSHFLMVRSALHVKATSSSSWQKVT